MPPLIARLGLHDDLLLTEFEGFAMGVIGRTIARAKADLDLARQQARRGRRPKVAA